MESGKVRSKSGRAWKVWNSTTKTIIFLGFHWNRAIERIFRFAVQIFGDTPLKSDTFDGCRRRRSLQSEKGSILIIFLTAFSSPLACRISKARQEERKEEKSNPEFESINLWRRKEVCFSLPGPAFFCLQSITMRPRRPAER